MLQFALLYPEIAVGKRKFSGANFGRWTAHILPRMKVAIPQEFSSAICPIAKEWTF
jgi:hypothetical protein